MQDDHVIVTIHHPSAARPVAQIALNGYNIPSGGVFGHSGPMRSFKLLDPANADALPTYWANQTALMLRGPEGLEATVRIYALPATPDSLGLVEFTG